MSTYSYFDQFKDTNVDLTPYLNNIKTNSGFDYTLTNLQSVKTTLKNLFERVDVVSDFKKNILYFDSYQIQDGERPEEVSFKVYNTTDNWWILCLFNNIKNIFLDWVWTEEQLQAMAQMLFDKENKYTLQTYYELLHARNESNRFILILKPFYLNDFTSAFRNAVGS